MKNHSLASCETTIRCSRLEDAAGAWQQFWYAITPQHPEPIAQQIERIERAERGLLAREGIDPAAAVVRRFFSSDLITQQPEFARFKERQSSDFFMSLIEQPPAGGAKAALLGMCLANITAKQRDGRLFYFDTAAGLRHIFAEHLIDPAADESSDAERQTAAIFADLQGALRRFAATIEGNVLRTWIYAPHVDADYPGVVRARKRLFDSINLTKDTHYIASTGIQGGGGDRFARVVLDAYAVCGAGMEQVRYIQAPEYMSPTHIYGVTFERAAAVRLADTDFLFISGTASIDKAGEIVHPGDVERQTDRTLENITALLEAAGFARADLSSLIIYLRDGSDYGCVLRRVREFAPDVPAVYVRAPVCRPGWLVEIEATAARMVR